LSQGKGDFDDLFFVEAAQLSATRRALTSVASGMQRRRIFRNGPKAIEGVVPDRGERWQSAANADGPRALLAIPRALRRSVRFARTDFVSKRVYVTWPRRAVSARPFQFCGRWGLSIRREDRPSLLATSSRRRGRTSQRARPCGPPMVSSLPLPCARDGCRMASAQRTYRGLMASGSPTFWIISVNRSARGVGLPLIGAIQIGGRHCSPLAR